MLARFGRVLYWSACGVAGLIALLAATVAVVNGAALWELGQTRPSAEEIAEAQLAADAAVDLTCSMREDDKSHFDCIRAKLMAPESSALLWHREWNKAKENIFLIVPAFLLLASGVWLIGRATRYVLAGE